jgi:hypothetical protein
MFRGFVRQRAPAAFQAGLTPRPSGSLVGALSFASPSRLAFSSSRHSTGTSSPLPSHAASALRFRCLADSSTSRPCRKLIRVRKGVAHARRLEGETARRDKTRGSVPAGCPFPFFSPIEHRMGTSALRGQTRPTAAASCASRNIITRSISKLWPRVGRLGKSHDQVGDLHFLQTIAGI